MAAEADAKRVHEQWARTIIPMKEPLEPVDETCRVLIKIIDEMLAVHP